jgi:tight adherence protein C
MLTFIMDNLVLVAFLTLIVLMIGVLFLVYGVKYYLNKPSTISQRMQSFVENPEKPSPPTIAMRIFPRELSGSFFTRTLKPVGQKIVNYFGKFTPASSVAQMTHKLNLAGNPYNMKAQDYYGLRVISLLIGIGFAFVINYGSNFSDLSLMALGFLLIVFFLFIPGLWLKSMIQSRKDELRRNLPDALDMLSVCVSAGLGFDQALKKIIEYWPTELSSEFRRMLQEMDMGVSRSAALRNLSNRVEVEEVTSFIAIIIQAESIGMSFSDVLHSQAKQMRVLRQYRAKEVANKMPAKMIIPLVLFIFPALIAVLIGPIVPTILNIFG